MTEAEDKARRDSDLAELRMWQTRSEARVRELVAEKQVRAATFAFLDSLVGLVGEVGKEILALVAVTAIRGAIEELTDG